MRSISTTFKDGIESDQSYYKTSQNTNDSFIREHLLNNTYTDIELITVDNSVENYVDNYFITLWISTQEEKKRLLCGYPQGY